MARLPTHIIGRRIKAALALVDRDGTWLAGQMGMPRTYLSTLMNAGRLDGAQLTEIGRLTGAPVAWLRGGGPSIVEENATAPSEAIVPAGSPKRARAKGSARRHA